MKGKRVVLTGAGGGIGAATVARLAAMDAEVVGIDVTEGPGIITADIQSPEQVRSALDRAIHRLGGLDILVNNAGIGRAHDAGDIPDEEARAVMEVNFFGAWTVTACAMPHLLSGRGHVVNVSSGLAFVDVPFAVAYSASKRALACYSAALRTEYGGRITVSTVFPGYIRTGIHDVPATSGVSLEGIVRADTVEQAASAIVRACITKKPDVTTSKASAVELWAARRFPRATRKVLHRRVRRWASTRPRPGLVTYPDPEAWLDS